MKKLVNLLKNYLTKSSPAVVTPALTEQFEKAKKDLLDQKHSGCECKHEAPTKKQVEVKKPAAKNTPKPKPKGK